MFGDVKFEFSDPLDMHGWRGVFIIGCSTVHN